MAQHRNALGRGLGSLIAMDDAPARGTTAINEIPLDRITPNPDQPRSSFDQEALDELASSIRELGIIQPISLRKTGPDSYQIIAGERRFRAASRAGLTTVPAYIRTASDSELTEMALIENIQREDLNPVEIALTFRKLIDQYSLTQEQLSERIGKKRATIANFLRLLNLPAQVQLGLTDGQIDFGHARALLSLDNPEDQLKVYREIVKHGLSVRKVEELVKAVQAGSAHTAPEKPTRRASHDYDILKKHLSASFQTPVRFSCNSQGRGHITFAFSSEEDLARLISIFDTLDKNAPANG